MLAVQGRLRSAASEKARARWPECVAAGTVLLSESVALAEDLLAFALLVGLQYTVAWLSVRSHRSGALVRSEPSPQLHRGRFFEGATRRQRVTRDEVEGALRFSGLARPEDAAVLRGLDRADTG